MHCQKQGDGGSCSLGIYTLAIYIYIYIYIYHKWDCKWLFSLVVLFVNILFVFILYILHNRYVFVRYALCVIYILRVQCGGTPTIDYRTVIRRHGPGSSHHHRLDSIRRYTDVKMKMKVDR